MYIVIIVYCNYVLYINYFGPSLLTRICKRIERTRKGLVHVRSFKLTEQMNEHKQVFLFMVVRLINYIFNVCSLMLMNMLNEHERTNIKEDT